MKLAEEEKDQVQAVGFTEENEIKPSVNHRVTQGQAELTTDEAKFLIDLMRQFRAGINFNVDNPDLAIAAAVLYKTIIEKLMHKAQTG